MAFSNEQHKRRYAEDSKHRERKLASNRAYRAEHRERLNVLWCDKWRSSAAYRERHASTRLETIYGLTAEQHRRLVEQQNGVCAICKQPSRRALCVDHCHASQRVRGLLCDKCNTALGLLDDDAGRMLAAVAYLDRAVVIPEAFTAGLCRRSSPASPRRPALRRDRRRKPWIGKRGTAVSGAPSPARPSVPRDEGSVVTDDRVGRFGLLMTHKIR